MKAYDLFLRLSKGLGNQNLKDLKWLFQERLDKDFFKWKNISLTELEQAQLESDVQKLLAGKPLAYVLGITDFYNCKIKVNEKVLIPRPETETLCEFVIKENKNKNLEVLDLCTGSGCIAIALAKNMPSFNLSASDISLDALGLAQENAILNNVQVDFMQSNLLQNVNKVFDIIVSNPPYLSELDFKNAPKSVVDFEPNLALFGGKDGLNFYREIAITAPNKLKENGLLYLEVGDMQAKDVSQILQEHFCEIEIKRDLFGVDRFVKARRK